METVERRHHKRIDVRALEDAAVEKYSKCPKYTTIVRHASLEDDSAFHCILLNSGDISEAVPLESQRDFIVPEQLVIMAKDWESGLFSVIRVTEPINAKDYWLVTSVTSRMGFILPFDKLPQELLNS